MTRARTGVMFPKYDPSNGYSASLTIFQSLDVLDYCLHSGSENVVIYFRDNIYIVKTLKEFQYLDEDGRDQGANVRQKAKDITNLLQDEGRLREERRSRASMRDRMTRGDGLDGLEEDIDENQHRRHPNGNQKIVKPNRDEDELRRAIEESKRSLAAEQAKQGHLTAEERDLQQAIRLSEEEEAKRNKAVEDSNSSSLFDDQQQLYVCLLRQRLFLLITFYIIGHPRTITHSRSSTLHLIRSDSSRSSLKSSLSSLNCNLNSLRLIRTNNKLSRKPYRHV